MQSLIDQYEVDVKIKRNTENTWCVFTRDAGRTQIEPNSLTTIAFSPVKRDKSPVEIKKMQCL